MVRLNLREVEQNADFRIWITGNPYKMAPSFFFFFFLGNTRDQAAACFAFSLAQKVFRNPTSELTKPHTHLIRFILSGSNSLTV